MLSKRRRKIFRYKRNATTRNINFKNIFNLPEITSIISCLIAYSFFMSAVHTLLFFSIIKLNPLYIPLSFSDYVVSFSAWVFSCLYLLSSFILPLFSITISENQPKKISFAITISMFFVFIFVISVSMFGILNNIYISLALFIVGIFIFFSIIKRWFGDFYKTPRETTVIVFILYTIVSCLFFGTEIHYRLMDAAKNIQEFPTANASVSGVLLRSFDKGILVYQFPDKTVYGDAMARLFFLPYEAGYVLKFPTKISLPLPAAQRGAVSTSSPDTAETAPGEAK